MDRYVAQTNEQIEQLTNELDELTEERAKAEKEVALLTKDITYLREKRDALASLGKEPPSEEEKDAAVDDAYRGRDIFTPTVQGYMPRFESD